MHAEPAAPGPRDRARAARGAARPAAPADVRAHRRAARHRAVRARRRAAAASARTSGATTRWTRSSVARCSTGRCRCTGGILCVSGRLSFELVQKAAVAGRAGPRRRGRAELAGGEPGRRSRHDARRLRPPRAASTCTPAPSASGLSMTSATPSAASPAEALAAWARACGRRQPGAPETVPLEDALGRSTHAPVRALRSSPAFPAAAMDGIAVRAADVAGARAPVELAQAFAVVDTGDPLPAGRTTPSSRASESSSTATSRASWRRRRAGATCARSARTSPPASCCSPPGHRLGPFDLALAAAGGHAELAVRRAADRHDPPDRRRAPPGRCRAGATASSPTPTRSCSTAQAREAGFRTLRGRSCPTTADRLAQAVERAAARATSCSWSRARAPAATTRARTCCAAAGRIVVRGVAMRPGHPAVLAVVDGTPVMGCPGYPVSAALAFDRLARPLLRPMRGRRRGAAGRRGAPRRGR